MNITWFVHIESTSICQFVNLQPSIAKLESSQCRGKVPQSSGVPAMAPSPCTQKIIKEMQWVQWCPWFPQPVRIWCMNESTMLYFSTLGGSFCSLTPFTLRLQDVHIGSHLPWNQRATRTLKTRDSTMDDLTKPYEAKVMNISPGTYTHGYLWPYT